MCIKGFSESLITNLVSEFETKCLQVPSQSSIFFFAFFPIVISSFNALHIFFLLHSENLPEPSFWPLRVLGTSPLGALSFPHVLGDSKALFVSEPIAEELQNFKYPDHYFRATLILLMAVRLIGANLTTRRRRSAQNLLTAVSLWKN